MPGPLLSAAAACALLATLCMPVHAQAPQRIASFNVCADQLVVTLADREQIVGLSPNASNPDLSTMAAVAGTYPQIPRHQAESILPLKPDLVLVGTWDRPLTQRILRSVGLRLESVDVVSDIDAGLRQIRSMAALLGHPERGEALVQSVEAARKRLAAVRRATPTRALLVGNGGYTVGPASLAGALLREAGLTPPPGAPAGYGGFIPLERLLVLRPDYLVIASDILTVDGQGALYLAHPALRQLYPPERRIVLPSRYTLCGGPSLTEVLDYLAGALARLPEGRAIP